MDFKGKFSFEKREAEATRVLKKYPDRIPVIVEKDAGADVPEIDKHKFLVPRDLTMGQFAYVIRKRIRIEPEKAIFMFVKNQLCPVSNVINILYRDNHEEDGFLYIKYGTEKTFGEKI